MAGTAAAHRAVGPAAVPFAVLAVAWFATTHARLALGVWAAGACAVGAGVLLWSLGAGPRLSVLACAGGLIGAWLVGQATRRAAVLSAGFWTGLLAAVGALVSGGPDAAGSALLADAGTMLAAGVAASAAVLTLGVPLEWLFGHVTRLTLSEWLNYDHPLIRELSLRAPGTFQHSNNVALLADAAARAIGADALVARVGALYHDVGKMQAPEYFIENQQGANPHDVLPPIESAAILRQHVTHGVALIREHRMGERLADFVREHHGTSVMRLLLDKAVAANDGRSTSPDAYRYPGPDPRSRETGILMMADQIEATARAVAPKDAAACEALLDAAIDRITSDGALAHARFRRRDLPLVRAAFLKVLAAMYHKRLRYPSPAAPAARGGLVRRLIGRHGRR